MAEPAASADTCKRHPLEPVGIMTVPDQQAVAPQGVEAQYCPHCGADKLAWTEPDGRGEVYSTTVVRRKPEAGGDYNVALIDLREGVRLMSRVEGVAPDAVHIGMAVRAQVAQQDGRGLLIFRPNQEAQ
jgi:uncharacterized OB-fold protein